MDDTSPLSSVLPDPDKEAAQKVQQAKLQEALQAELKARMQTHATNTGENVLAARGLIGYGENVYRVYYNCPSHNPWRQLRKKMGITSGRQWKKFCKQTKLRKRVTDSEKPKE